VEICTGLILNTNDKSAFLGAHFLYLFIQENINIIIKSTEFYLKIKDLLLNNLIHKCDKFSLLIIKRICYSISIILAVGSLTINSDFIEEIIQFGQSSITNCYISVIIINNVYFEFTKLSLEDTNIKEKIIHNLKEKMPLVLEFLNFLLENFNLNENLNDYLNNLNVNNYQLENGIESSNSKITIEEIKSEILNLIHSLIKLDVNILFVHKIFHTLVSSFNANNSEKISFIIADCVKHQSSAAFYDKSTIYNVEKLINDIDYNHIQILEGLVNFIDDFRKNKLETNLFYNHNNFNISKNCDSNFKDQQENQSITTSDKDSNKLDLDKIEILAALAYILNSILQNYVFLIFLDNNNLSQVIYDNFIFFLSCKNKRISSKMFKPLECICSFLKESEFENYSKNITLDYDKTVDQIKEEISIFLINVTGLIMFNCRFKTISIPILKQETIISNFNKIELEEENDWDDLNDAKFLSVFEYRLQAREAFFDIFSVFAVNLRKNGVHGFLSYINDIIDNNNLLKPFDPKINLNEVSEKEKREKVNMIEVVMQLLRSIVSQISEEEEYVELFLHLILKIFSSQVIYDEFILCSFLQLLNDIPDLINRNKTLFKKTMELLVLTLKNRKFQFISSDSVAIISETCAEPEEEMFYLFYKTYIENFNLYESNSISSLSFSLINFVNCSKQVRTRQYSDEQFLYFIELILTPVTASLDNINQFINRPDILASFNSNMKNNNNEIIMQLKKTIIKGLSIYSKIFTKHQSSEVFTKIFLFFYVKVKDILEFCYKFLTVDSDLEGTIYYVINEIYKSYKNINKINDPVDVCVIKDPFTHFCSILVYSFIRNPNYLTCLRLYNDLSENLIPLTTDKNEIFFRNCLLIIEKTEEVSKNFQDLYFIEHFPFEYLRLWTFIFKSGMSNIFFDLIKFNTFIEVLLKMFSAYDKDDTFNKLDLLVSFFTEFISQNKIFPKEFFEDKLNKLVKGTIDLLYNLRYSEIVKVCIHILT